jgi:hypothetical protein
MTTLTHPAQASDASGRFDLFRFLADLARRAAATRALARARTRARRDYAWLRGLDDHFLADMGLTRGAIDRAERAL